MGGSGGTTGDYTMQAILNAVFKPATASNNTIATAYNLDSAFESLGTTPAADRAGVVGTLGATPSDFYAFTLTAGEYATIADKGTSGTASLALYDSSGNLMTEGTSGTGVDSIIEDLVAPFTGTYYAAVTGATGLGYDLIALRGPISPSMALRLTRPSHSTARMSSWEASSRRQRRFIHSMTILRISYRSGRPTRTPARTSDRRSTRRLVPQPEPARTA